MLLDPAKRDTLRALNSPNLIHGAVELAFQGVRDRTLWRIDHLAGRYWLLIVSSSRPDLASAAQQFGMDGTWETLDYNPFLNRIKEGSVWHFRLVANPTKSCPVREGQGIGQRGLVRAHSSVRYQKAWLLDRAEKHGFALNEDNFNVVQTKWNIFNKGGANKNRISLLGVTYEGVLTVIDTGVFLQSLTQGIGRGKAYGLGMLTVARPMGEIDG
mgnify:FL=1